MYAGSKYVGAKFMLGTGHNYGLVLGHLTTITLELEWLNPGLLIIVHIVVLPRSKREIESAINAKIRTQQFAEFCIFWETFMFWLKIAKAKKVGPSPETLTRLISM